MSQAAIPNPADADCIAFETISIVVPSLKVLSDHEGKSTPVSSPNHKIGGLTWRIEVHKVLKENKPVKLDLYVFCNEDVKEQLWLCKVFFKVHSGYLDPSAKLTYSYKHFYGFNTYYWILLDIFNENNYDVIPHPENSPIEIKLDIKISHISQNLPALDTSLVVNMDVGKSETLLVNKHVMATFSSYFRNLFFEDWNDKKERGGKCFELIETKEFDTEAFKFMIYAAMTMGWMVHESNFLDYSISIEIVKLAIKYDFPMMVDYCQKYLVGAKDYSKMDLLELADQHGLVQLKEHCLKEMSALDYMEESAKNTEIHTRLSKSTREQLQSKLDGKAKEVQDTMEELKESIQAIQQNTTLVEPFNKLAKALLGQRASTVTVATLP